MAAENLRMKVASWVKHRTERRIFVIARFDCQREPMKKWGENHEKNRGETPWRVSQRDSSTIKLEVVNHDWWLLSSYCAHLPGREI